MLEDKVERRRKQKRESYYRHRDKAIARIKPQAMAKHKKLVESLAGEKRPSVCDVCWNENITRGKIAAVCYDHCHATGAFRGWLCSRCNMVLGKIKDDVELLNKMIKYLEKQ